MTIKRRVSLSRAAMVGLVAAKPEAAYGDWLLATPEQSMEFMHPYPADKLVAHATTL